MAVALSLLITSPAFAYTVKSGDTMSKIAKENNVTLQELSRLNPQVKNLDLIYVGQTINTETLAEAKATTPTVKATSEDRELMARLVRAEATGEPFAGKVAVAVVVLNRVDSKDFPNTVHDVIYQSGQFTPVVNGQINVPATDEDYKAVDEALSEDRSKGAGSLFYYNPATATSRWLDSRPTTVVIGHHVFKR